MTPTDTATTLSRPEAILRAVSFAAGEVLWGDDPQLALDRTIERLGAATGASRVYTFENGGDEDLVRIHARAEWAAPGIESQTDNEELDGASYEEAGFDRWRSILERGGTVQGHVHEFPEAERPLLEAQEIRSLLVVPIFAGTYWWGFMGFDACEEEREWSAAEIDALRTVADTLGIALQRRAIETALRDSEERYRVIFDRGNDAIFLHGVDADGSPTPFTEVNEVACRLLGYSREELMRRRTADILHVVPPAAERVDMRALEPGMGVMFERVLADREGQPIPVEINARVLELNGERFMISIARDMRERKQAEAALARSQAELQQAQKMEAVGRLAGGVAHDFNNLLTGIKGTAELALEEMTGNGRLRADVEEILRTADRAAALTGQLLAFSRRHIIEPVVVDLEAVLADTDRMLRRLIGEQIELSTHFAPGLQGVRMGNGQIEQVILNLAINARDAMPDGGSLRIGAENEDLEEGTASPLEPGPYIALTFRDTGTGMDEATLQHVFEPFFTTKQPGRGTGLGLSTVYGIIQQAGGSVSVTSRPGDGTTFRILLPAVPPRAAATPTPRVEDVDLVGNGERILLVEDEAAVSELVRRVLEKKGYDVVMASTGEEALDRADADLDLLITDVVLPGLGGRDVARSLKGAYPSLRVVFMSGYSQEEVDRHGVTTPEYFLQKPFSPNDLLRTVRQVLGDLTPPA